jgi:hypothetical protein
VLLNFLGCHRTRAFSRIGRGRCRYRRHRIDRRLIPISGLRRLAPRGALGRDPGSGWRSLVPILSSPDLTYSRACELPRHRCWCWIVRTPRSTTRPALERRIIASP